MKSSRAWIIEHMSRGTLFGQLTTFDTNKKFYLHQRDRLARAGSSLTTMSCSVADFNKHVRCNPKFPDTAIKVNQLKYDDTHTHAFALSTLARSLIRVVHFRLIVVRAVMR